MTPKIALLRMIPILGWLYLAFGAGRALRGRPLRHPLARAAWWLDAVLSVVVHAAQVPAAVRVAGGDRSPLATALLTMTFGMTWWKTQPGSSTKETNP